MKNLIIFSMLAVMVVINFSGCGKAQERPAQLNKEIKNQIVAIDGLVDITKAEHQNSEENIAFKKKLIAKLDSAERRTYAESLMAQNKLVYMLMNGKIILLEYVAGEQNKHITVSSKVDSASATETVSATAQIASATVEVAAEEVQSETKLYTFEALMLMKNGKAQEWSKVSQPSENRFAILAEFEIQTGILENETTVYNEKKSVLKLTETSLEQAQFLILKSEIKAVASGDAQK